MMNKEEATRLSRRAQALRAKAVYVSDTGESVPPAEKAALESKAKELEERVRTEYRTNPRKRSDWTTERPNWSGQVYGQHHFATRPTQQDKSWVYEQEGNYLNAYFSNTVPDEIIEEDYLYDNEEDDY
jgi:hypothetical protein